MNNDEYIAHCICCMDIEALSEALDEQAVYMEADLDVFLNKLSGVFSELQKAGDDYLEMYSGSCDPSMRACDSRGQRGFRFVGNQSRDYFNLVFNQNGLDDVDFCDCIYFKTDRDTGGVRGQKNIYMGKDEKADFNDPAYDAICKQADEAVKALISEGGLFYTVRQIKDWLKQFKNIFEKLPQPFVLYERVRPFRQLFKSLQAFVDSFPPRVEVRLALDKYPGKDAPPSELIEWHENYSELAYNSRFLKSKLQEYDKIPSYIELSRDPEVRVLSQPLIEHLQFIKWHSEAAPKRVRNTNT